MAVTTCAEVVSRLGCWWSVSHCTANAVMVADDDTRRLRAARVISCRCPLATRLRIVGAPGRRGASMAAQHLPEIVPSPPSPPLSPGVHLSCLGFSQSGRPLTDILIGVHLEREPDLRVCVPPGSLRSSWRRTVCPSLPHCVPRGRRLINILPDMQPMAMSYQHGHLHHAHHHTLRSPRR